MFSKVQNGHLRRQPNWTPTHGQRRVPQSRRWVRCHKACHKLQHLEAVKVMPWQLLIQVAASTFTRCGDLLIILSMSCPSPIPGIKVRVSRPWSLPRSMMSKTPLKVTTSMPRRTPGGQEVGEVTDLGLWFDTSVRWRWNLLESVLGATKHKPIQQAIEGWSPIETWRFCIFRQHQLHVESD